MEAEELELLFQSLFRCHSQISQLPGVFYYDNFFNQVEDLDNSQIADKFTFEYSHFFDSRKNKIERHDQLGENKKNFYLISKSKFKKKFIELNSNNKNNKKNILQNIHLAYSYASGENIFKKKILVLHIHHLNRVAYLKKMKFEIIYSMRDPLASVSSYYTNWNNFNAKLLTSEKNFLELKRNIYSLNEVISFKKKVFIIQLEKLHLINEEVMKNFCLISKIKYEKSMQKSTFQNLKWWGDKISVKYLNGINKKLKNKINK